MRQKMNELLILVIGNFLIVYVSRVRPQAVVIDQCDMRLAGSVVQGQALARELLQVRRLQSVAGGSSVCLQG